MKINKTERLNESDCNGCPEMMEEKENYSTTREIAEVLRIQPQTIIRGLCINGNYLGMKPKKLPNSRLLWPRSELKKLLNN